MGVSKFFLPLVFLGMVLAEPRWYNSSDGRRYFIDGDQKYNWLSAHQACSRKNLQLVEIKSAAKNEALVELLTSVFGGSIDLWLGANDEFNTNKDYDRPFYWSSSGKRMDFSNWSANNPDNANTQEHCVQTWGQSENFEWNDLQCTEQIGFICEEQPTHKAQRNSMQEKGQKVIEITRQLFGTQQQELKQTMAKLNRIVSLVVQKNNEIARFLEKIQQNLDQGNGRAVQTQNRELQSYVADTMKTVRQLDEEMQEAAQQMYNKFSKEFNAAQQTIGYILGNVKE